MRAEQLAPSSSFALRAPSDALAPSRRAGCVRCRRQAPFLRALRGALRSQWLASALLAAKGFAIPCAPALFCRSWRHLFASGGLRHIRSERELLTDVASRGHSPSDCARGTHLRFPRRIFEAQTRLGRTGNPVHARGARSQAMACIALLCFA